MAKRSNKKTQPDSRQANLFEVQPDTEQTSQTGSDGKSSKSAERQNRQNNLKNVIQQASAGTGKTFALSNRFLQLIVDGAEPDTILASTFTRKGAGEILDRILTRLGMAAVDECAAQVLGAQLERALDCTRARQLLRKIVDCLPSLQIGTLDSFFNRIAKAFCFEIGLPPDWEVVDPLRTRALRDQAIESILGEQNTAQLLRLMSKAEADRRVADLLARTVDELFEVYRDSTPTAWDQFGDPRPVSAKEREELIAKLAQLAALPSQVGRQRDKLIECLENGEWEDAAGLGVVKKVREGETHYSRQEIPDVFRALIKETLSLIKRQVCLLVSSRTKATRDLLASFDAVLQPLQLDAGELEFSDVTYHLARTIQLQPREVADRLGRKIEHLLLDEFQDTSPLQWAVVKPLADHVTQLASGRTFFCVGDRKQAIYGWRGGVDRIFDAVEKDFGSRIETAPPLLESFRSCQAVLDLVNSVFGSFHQLAETDPDAVSRSVLKAWAGKFEAHRPAKTELKGYAEVKVAPANEDDDVMEDVLLETIAEVKRLYERYPDKEIAVLFRGNSPIAPVAVHLQRAGIATSEEAGNPLTDSAAVEVILSALTLADHPGDSVARFHLSHSPLGERLGLVPETKESQQTNEQRAQEVAAGIRDELLADGYGSTIRRWSRVLGAKCTEREAQRLEQLVEVAYDYDATWTLRPYQFVEHVREQRVADRTGARVRLMTMHASKGLGFDIVVAPLNKTRSGWTSSPPEVVTGRSDPAGPIDAVSRYVRSDDRPLLPERIQDVFDEYQAQQINEELCLLYVTLTRAKQHLSVILPPKAEPAWANVVGVLLRALTSQSESEDSVIASFGDPNWMAACESAIESEETAKSPQVSIATEQRITLAQSVATGRGAQWLTPSSSRRKETAKAQARGSSRKSKQNAVIQSEGETPRRDREAAQDRGVACHRLLQQIEWLESLPLRETLLKSLSSVVAEPKDRDQIVDELAELVRTGDLATWLSEPAYRDAVLKRHYSAGETLIEPLRIDVYREFPFVVELDGRWLEGQIDRLILISEGDQLVAAEVLDFKTGELGEGELDLEIERYAEQLQWYCDAVCELFQLPSEKVHGFIGFTAVRDSQGNVVSCVAESPTNE
jgi:ATP-dependent exoDNAse (exonuclease V) beta subunit